MACGVACGALLLAGGSPAGLQRPPQGAPTLLVILVVDQMRFDYLDRFHQFWTAGFKRLREEGAIFDRAFYPYLNTVTCPGHATIGTGAYPYAHGILLNEWWRRPANRRMACTDDEAVTPIPYGGSDEGIGHSAVRLRIPTLADRIRLASPTSRVVVASMKPRSTVMLAGHGGTAVTWFSDANVWSTSTAYAPGPVSEVQTFVAANPVERERPVVWDRLLDAQAYRQADDGLGERPPSGWTSRFPHPLNGVPGTPEHRFFDLWERSPYSDAYLGRMAAGLVDSFALGQRGVTDLLAVSFSAVDYVGHDFGPDSQEIQDTLIRLDRTLGDLFATLDAKVGRNRYAVGLSADHGVSGIPEQLTPGGINAGRVLGAEVRKVAEAALVAAYGPGPHIQHVEFTNVYFTDDARRRAAADPAWVSPAITAISRMDGVMRAFRSSGLDAARSSDDPVVRAAALSHVPDEGGDLVVVLQPNWIGSGSSAATHGSLQPYDQHVPVIFLGPAFAPGRYSNPASPADLAPTLASLVGVPIPGVDGKVLRTPR
ncbi:MAG: alkaline phosphatase family protein [Acidobacteriota bacterium]